MRTRQGLAVAAATAACGVLLFGSAATAEAQDGARRIDARTVPVPAAASAVPRASMRRLSERSARNPKPTRPTTEESV